MIEYIEYIVRLAASGCLETKVNRNLVQTNTCPSTNSDTIVWTVSHVLVERYRNSTEYIRLFCLKVPKAIFRYIQDVLIEVQ